MVLIHRNIASIILIILFANSTARAKKTKHKCPIGFSLAYTKYKGDDPICYRRKGPEAFGDKFKDCVGNLYTSQLYHTLNFTEPNLVLWTDYRSLYPGGPFVDESFTESTGQLLLTTYEVNRRFDPTLGLDEELCVVIDPVTNFTATRCDEKHYRYCFLKPYVSEDDMDRDGCGDGGYWRFWSPKATCLTAVTGAGGGAVRANWRQAKELCAKRGGSLLNKGWRYANNPVLSSSTNPTFPLGIVLSPDNSSIRYDVTTEDAVIPSSEWQFENKVVTNETSLGALRDSFWYMVNTSYIFFDVICERPIDLRPVGLNVTVNPDSKIILRTNETVDGKDVYCFTDSVIHYPTRIKFKYDDDTGYYVLTPIADGHYWCVHLNSRNHIVSQSNTALFIRVKQELENYYAIKFRMSTEYSFENLETSFRNWERILEEYIFVRNKYEKVYGEIEATDASTLEDVLKSFKESNRLELRDRKMIRRMKIKRLFLDAKTVLVHIELNTEMKPVAPGRWQGLDVEYMKPIYFCKGFDSIPTRELGTSTISAGCRNHTCVGDFDEGVQWVTTAAQDCATSPPTPVTAGYMSRGPITMVDAMPTATVRNSSPSSDLPLIQSTTPGGSNSEESTELWTTGFTSTEILTTEYLTTSESPPPTIRPTLPPAPSPSPSPSTTTVQPTTVTETVSTVTLTTETVSTAYPTFPPSTRPPTPRPPNEQLQQVLEELENLLSNDSIPVVISDLNSTFDQVDNLLQVDEDLEIPGELLHLLDEIGARIDLNGSGRGSAVRSNIALVLADAEPETPVKGLRIAATANEMFTDDDFEIISEEVNSTHMTSNTTEAVVHLPDSVASSSRRISFVVFRNDRAFRSNHGTYAVNSRVLSIKVENLTHFEEDEFIDIHLSPMNEGPDRNLSRACAYWHFFDDGSGYWSQEGCTLIKSLEEGILDTCRCNHLTHFAEVLVPRTVFSEKNENVLEILTIIGCCLSIFGLALVGLTAALFRSWRRDYSNKIWLQLCIAIFMLATCFLIIVFAKFETYDVPCMLVGVALHYSVLASFCWMLVAAVLSYRRLVIVFTRDASHKLLRASAFSWGAPCAVVGILLSVSPHSYQGRFEEKTPSGAFCYPSGLGLWLAVYAPIALMLVANWTLFALIVRSVFASRRIQRHGDSNEAIRCASVSCLLVFLFGLPWLFGLFAYNVVAAYLFTLTSTFQGFVLFLFFVLGNKKTRDLWLNKLKIKQTRKIPVTSSTYTHRSIGTGSRVGGGASTIEANSSKPRSLNSPDNSRFS